MGRFSIYGGYDGYEGGYGGGGGYRRGGGGYSKSTYTKSSSTYKPAFKSSGEAGTGSGHALEYAPTGKAKCSLVGGCKGLIEVGTLRYGQDTPSQLKDGGEIVVWKHWGCMQPENLKILKPIGVTKIRGWTNLNPSTKEKVKLAIKTGSIAESDKTIKDASTVAPHASQSSQAESSRTNKRKLEDPPVPSSSQTQVASQANISASQFFADEQDPEIDEFEMLVDEVYVSLNTKVVGVRYYNGMVGVGEMVVLRREPTNKYDSNSIRVLNATGAQVGHIPKAVAANLSPLLDREEVIVEGVMLQSNMTSRITYELGITLHICGPADPATRSRLEPKLIWATPGQRGFEKRTVAPSQASASGPYASQFTAPSASQRSVPNGPTPEQLAAAEAVRKAAELSTMMNGLAKVDDAGRRATVLDALCADDILELPLHPDPPSKEKGNLLNNLLKHQLQGLLWCIRREYPQLPKTEDDKPVQFWKLVKQGNQSHYLNTVTKSPQADPPLLGRGAIMADSMGLGKTLTMLALIIATLEDKPTEYSNSSLIVVPLSVISNWQSQIAEHTPGNLKVHVYHNTGRSITAEKLSTMDVVLTTYQTVAIECKGDATAAAAAPAKKKAKSDGGLFGVKWKRVILDEGHTIRNVKAKMSVAVCTLEAERRWVVTGTPIVNSPNDLGSLLTFLRVCTPLDQPDYFKRLLARPLTQASLAATELLKNLMSTMCLRRTKEMQDKDGNTLVPLPPVEVTLVRVKLQGKERELYDNIFAEAQLRFKELIDPNEVEERPTDVAAPVGANVLSMLTRLRQLTLHPSLIPPTYLDELRAASKHVEHPDIPVSELTSQERIALQLRLYQAVQDVEECSICFNSLENPRILPCTHYFCLSCITEVISRQQLCPMDRRTISMNDLLEPALPPSTQFVHNINDGSDDEVDYDNLDLQASTLERPTSSKIQHLISLLQLIPSDEKSLVFSQFTSYLDLISDQLDQAGIPYARFDGTMTARARQQVLEEFSIPLDEQPNEDSEDEAPIRRAGSRKGKAEATGPKNPVVLLISLKAGALGLNLTVASRVFLMDPWWQSAIELQAIDRVNRIGQKKNVYVYQMVADDTVETRVLAIQERKKLLIEQAFSGTRRKETLREKKEARLQDLVEVFGTQSSGKGKARAF